MVEQYNVKCIRTLLTEGFSAEQLRRLCYDEPDFRAVYDNFAQDTGKATVINRLLEYATQNWKMEALLTLAQEINPAMYKKYQPYTNLPPSPSIPPEPADFAYDVFISYSQADRAWVQKELLPRLAEEGLRVCIDYRDFQPGAPRPTEVERAVLTSRRTLFILTPAYLESEWDEFGILMLQTIDPASRQRRLIPLYKEKCELSPRLSFLWPVDFVEPVDRDLAWAQLLATLKTPLELLRK